MKKLKFKNTGKYPDEASSRYIARFTKNSFVIVYKSAYNNKWRVKFLDRIGLEIDEINQNMMFNDNNKKDVVKILNYWLNNDTNLCNEIEYLSNKLADKHNEWRFKQNKEPYKNLKF